jgi:membrane-associated protease RseP (regulator of RpoE activity)
MEILGILAFVVALLLSVMVHEFGHYITARKFNMKVTEFFLGFGKRIWSFRKVRLSTASRQFLLADIARSLE